MRSSDLCEKDLACAPPRPSGRRASEVNAIEERSMLPAVRRLAALLIAGTLSVGACPVAFAQPLKTWGAEPPNETPEPPPQTTPPPPPPPASTPGTPTSESPESEGPAPRREPPAPSGLRYVLEGIEIRGN